MAASRLDRQDVEVTVRSACRRSTPWSSAPGGHELRSRPVWSPDGSAIAFFADGQLRRIGADGGAIRRSARAGEASRELEARRHILFTPGAALHRGVGGRRQAGAGDDSRCGARRRRPLPSFLPDGRHFVFAARNVDPARLSSCSARPSRRRPRALAVGPTRSGRRRDISCSRGREISSRRGSTRGDARGRGRPPSVADSVRFFTDNNRVPASAGGNRRLRPSGTMRRLVWVDRKGGRSARSARSRLRGRPDLALRRPRRRGDPRSATGWNLDVWILDVGAGPPSRLSTDRFDEFLRSGLRTGSGCSMSPTAAASTISTSGRRTGARRRSARDRAGQVRPDGSPDGRAPSLSAPRAANYARALSPVLRRRGDPVRLASAAVLGGASPRFRRTDAGLAFDSDESGRSEIYVPPFPKGPKRQVSIGGGQIPVWSRDGNELFYALARRDADVRVRPNWPGRLEIGEPQPLFALRPRNGGQLAIRRHPYDVSPDGQRFLVIRRRRTPSRTARSSSRTGHA